MGMESQKRNLSKGWTGLLGVQKIPLERTGRQNGGWEVRRMPGLGPQARSRGFRQKLKQTRVIS